MTIRLLLMIVTALFALPLPLLSAERDYIRELESLPREGRTAYLQSLTESDFLSFGHQCYREAVDEESILMVVFGGGLLPLWKKSPPSPDVYLPLHCRLRHFIRRKHQQTEFGASENAPPR